MSEPLNHDRKQELELEIGNKMISFEKQQELCNRAKKVAVLAGEAILQIYNNEPFQISTKTDQSPLTAADKAAHQIIKHGLQETNIPILSEEGKEVPFSVRSPWDFFWLVDPLDGTKEFIKRNGEFTVNIALIHKQTPVMGFIYVPVQELLYWGGTEIGAFKQNKAGAKEPLKTLKRNPSETGLSIVASRSHLNDETKTFMSTFNNPEIVSMGSSLKFMVLAEGKAQYYPRFAPTMEWDTAAAQAILEAAGGSVTIANTDQPLKYNKENLLNPYFLAQA